MKTLKNFIYYIKDLNIGKDETLYNDDEHHTGMYLIVEGEF